MVFLGVVPIREEQYVISYSYVRSQPLSDPNAISGRACRTGAALSFLSGRGHTGAFRYIPYNSVGITLLRRAGGACTPRVLPTGARTGQFAAECLRCQFAGVAALRSALRSYRTFTTRGLYFIDRCGFDGDVL